MTEAEQVTLMESLKRDAIERCGITEADIKSVDIWTGQVRLWNWRRIQVWEVGRDD